MSAQINLFQDHLRKPRELLSGWRVTVLCACVFVITLATAGIHAGMWYMTRSQIAELKQQHQHLIAQRSQLSAQLARYTPDPLLSAEVLRLEAILKLRGPVAKALETDWFQGTKGYSDYFVALARQHVAGMWLTGIRITGAGSAVELTGNTVDPRLLPQFLQRLSQEQILNGTEFDQMMLGDPEADKSTASVLSFSVTTAP